MLLCFSLKIRQKHIHNANTLVGLLTAEYEEGGDGAEEYEDVEFTGMRGMVSRSSELSDVEYSFTSTRISEVCDERVKKVHTGMRIIMDGLYKCDDDWFPMIR